MSELRLRREGDPERTARVWQPAEFGPLASAGSFVARRWGAPAPAGFQPRELVPRPPVLPESSAVPEPEAVDLAASEPEPVDVPEAEALAAAPGPGWVSPEELELVRQHAYEQGQADGREQALQDMQEASRQDGQRLQEHLQAIAQAVQQLQQRPEDIFEPLKRLALHLAEQLVLAELSVSPQAIERLVRRCVDELASKSQPVHVALHPDDLARLQAWLEQQGADTGSDGPSGTPQWLLQADDSLLPGSVRASADDAVVSDLIEHRLDALARQLLLPAPRVAAQSAFQRERLASRRAEADTVLDAQPRMADAPRNPRFAPVVEAEPPKGPGPADAPPALEDGHD